MTRPAQFGDGVSVRIVRVASVQGEARVPGEIGGPAVAMTVRVTNGSRGTIDLGTAVVNLYYGRDKTPALPLSGPPTSPLSGRLAPGAAATGTYTFTISKADRRLVIVEFSYSGTSAVVVFRGSFA